jgi:hypothetical protein
MRELVDLDKPIETVTCPVCGHVTIFYTENTLKSVSCAYCFLDNLWSKKDEELKNETQ